ncbi:MAG: type III-A CRISPR-associated RAMP protein Csm4 [Anaerolineae bacterium]
MAGLLRYDLIPPPGGGFHFGRAGYAQEETGESFPSDSLWAALLATIAEEEGMAAARALVDRLRAGEPPFALTSVLPRAGDIPFLPRPALPLAHGSERRPPKFGKRLRYVSPGILHLWLQGEDLAPYLPDDAWRSPKGRFLQGGAVWCTAEEQARLPKVSQDRDWAKLPPERLAHEKLWDGFPRPRVTVDRRSHASAVFRVGRLSFASGCGLWLGVRFAQDPGPFDQTWWEAWLLRLGHRGLGGDRTAGCGTFSWEAKGPLPLPEAAGGDRALLLSRYHPRPDELAAGVLGDGARYQLAFVSGYLASPKGPARLRQRVALVEAGSVVCTAGGLPRGDLVDVTPPGWQAHPVYRGGLALAVPILGPSRR